MRTVAVWHRERMEDTPVTYRTSGSATIEISAPAAEVFAILTDLERLPMLSPSHMITASTSTACSKPVVSIARRPFQHWILESVLTV